MRSEEGALFSIAEGEAQKHDESPPAPVIGVCSSNGRLAVLTCDLGKTISWHFRRHAGDRWPVEAIFKSEGDELIAFDCDVDAVTVVTNKRLLVSTAGKQKVVTLSETLTRGLTAAIHVTRDRVLVGLNMGEWGGGLHRIDRKTGTVKVIERNTTGELCRGPLDTGCDPVHAIVAEPWKPDCVVAAIGVIHLRPHGRLVEVCGDRVQRLFFRPFGQQFAEDLSPTSENVEPRSTVAFFGLARVVDALWAVGNDGLYRVSASGVELQPLPEFKDVGEIQVSFGLPRIVLVLTDINRRMSVSTSVPIMVPR